MAARKLTPDSKRANVGGIELHALLQVFESFTLLHNNNTFSLKSQYQWCITINSLCFGALQPTVAALPLFAASAGARQPMYSSSVMSISVKRVHTE